MLYQIFYLSQMAAQITGKLKVGADFGSSGKKWTKMRSFLIGKRRVGKGI